MIELEAHIELTLVQKYEYLVVFEFWTELIRNEVIEKNS